MSANIELDAWVEEWGPKLPDEAVADLFRIILEIDNLAQTATGESWKQKADLHIYDNGGESFDRYTVIKSGRIWHMSANAGSPQGVCNYYGPARTVRRETLGRLLPLEEVPNSVLEVARGL